MINWIILIFNCIKFRATLKIVGRWRVRMYPMQFLPNCLCTSFEFCSLNGLDSLRLLEALVGWVLPDSNKHIDSDTWSSSWDYFLQLTIHWKGRVARSNIWQRNTLVTTKQVKKEFFKVENCGRNQPSFVIDLVCLSFLILLRCCCPITASVFELSRFTPVFHSIFFFFKLPFFKNIYASLSNLTRLLDSNLIKTGPFR